MPGPAPGIHVFGRIWKKGVDGRDNPRIKFGDRMTTGEFGEKPNARH